MATRAGFALISAIVLLATGACSSGAGSQGSSAWSDATSDGSAAAGTQGGPVVPGSDSYGSGTATDPTQGTPDRSYIAVCDTDGLRFFDPQSGAELGTTSVDLGISNSGLSGGTDPTGATGTFRTSGNGYRSGEGCGDLSYNSDLTRIAGLDEYPSGDTVPAYLDLASGTVTDLVAPLDHSGLEAVDPIVYDLAVYDPTSDVLWSDMRGADTADGEETHRVRSTTGKTRDYVCSNGGGVFSVSLIFESGKAEPLLDANASECRSSLGVADEDKMTARYLDPNLLPKSDYAISRALLSTSGANAAFVASPPDSTVNYLYRISAKGGTPARLGEIPSNEQNLSGPAIVGYRDR